MRLSAPRGIIFLISLILAVVALLIEIDVLNLSLGSISTFWLAFSGWVVLAVGNILRGV